LRQALQQDAQKILEIHEKAARILGPTISRIFISQAAKSTITKASRGMDLDLADSDRYLKVAWSADIVGVLLDDNIRPMMLKVPFDTQAEIEALKTKQFLEYQASMTDRETSPAWVGVMDAKCRRPLAALVGTEQSQLRLRQAQARTAEIKKTAQQLVTRFLSGKALLNVQHQIADTTFALPTSPTEILDNIRAQIRDVTEDYETSIRLHENDPQAFDRTAVLLAMVMNELVNSNQTSSGNVEDAQPDFLQYCLKQNPHAATDYTLTAMQSISVSWYTVNFPEIGVAILAHEMGHVVSSLLRNAKEASGAEGSKFGQSLACVADRNPFALERLNLISPFSNTTSSEEDWADHFSSLLMNEMNAEPKFRNLGCALVRDSGRSYEGDGLEPDYNDPHSSGFLRLLMVAHDRKMMTPACAGFLNYAEKSGRELTCP
jgi:hypothetical protein